MLSSVKSALRDKRLFQYNDFNDPDPHKGSEALYTVAEDGHTIILLEGMLIFRLG